MTSPTTAPACPAPDAATVLAACRAAIAPIHGGGAAVVTPTAEDALGRHGVLVRFTDHHAHAEALAALRALGYAAGQADHQRIMVTGWYGPELDKRLTRLEASVSALLEDHADVAADALSSYRLWVERHGHLEDATEQAAAHDHAQAPWQRAADIATRAGGRHVVFPVAEADLSTAPDLIADVLVRIAAAQTRLDKLAGVYAGTARGAIALYRHHRARGLTADRAAAAALQHAAAAAPACLELVTTDVAYPRANAGAILADDTGETLAALRSPEERLTALRISNRIRDIDCDLCRHCSREIGRVRLAGGEFWSDTHGDYPCTASRAHEPFPGADRA